MTPALVELIPSAIMVWRDDLDRVRFEVLSPLFAVLIEQLNQNRSMQLDLYQVIESLLPDLSAQEIKIQIYELKALLTRLRLIHVPHNYGEIQG